MKKTTLILGLLVYFSYAKAQDIIWLKSGRTLKGRIFSFTDNSVKIKVGKDSLTYVLSEIKSLQYNGPMYKNSAGNHPEKVCDIKKEDETEAKPVKINPAKII